MQTALHRRISIAGANELDCFGRGRMAIRRVDESQGRDIEFERRRQCLYASLRSNQHRLDDLRLGRFDGATKRGLVTGMRNSRAYRRQRMAGINQRVIFFVLARFGHDGSVYRRLMRKFYYVIYYVRWSIPSLRRYRVFRLTRICTD